MFKHAKATTTAIVLFLLAMAGWAYAGGAAPPRSGKGLVIFTFVKSGSFSPPPYLEAMEAEGWRIEFNPIAADYSHEKGYAAAIRQKIDAARREGQSNIALVGESFGAWVSLLANSSFETPIDAPTLRAIVAIDASAATSGAKTDAWHDYKFVNLLKTQDATRMVIILYDAPPSEAEERRDEITHSLSNRVSDFVVTVEQPPIDGPDGPHGDKFAKRYTAEIVKRLRSATPQPAGAHGDNGQMPIRSPN